ncbi:MAG TPA: isoprenylcysteine carboxylmethyltransferase family protein [Acidimicrobiia bacterium]|nr:isoprenylcysteine carboxylmethyltransferase family protein [Acidimicrobiia bacterium]
MHGRTRWRWRNFPVPESHLAFLGAGTVLHLARPRKITTASGRQGPIGWLIITVGAGLAAWATRSASDTDLESPDRVVTTGLYAISRHPMYVSWTLIYLGAALVINSVWPIRLLPMLLLAIHREALREEDRLEGRFGSAYGAYRSRVRRYV